jgi:hypothetical protein
MDSFQSRARALLWGATAVSSHDPAERVVDRPKMAEALASLKEGLGENDDPLYDGWKLRNGAGAADNNLEAAREAASVEGDATDTVPVRVVRYPVFPRWALLLAAALVAFAGVVTAVRLVARTSAPPVTPSPATPDRAQEHRLEEDEIRAELPLSSSAEATASAVSAPLSRKVKGKKPKTQDPGFFRDPGF